MPERQCVDCTHQEEWGCFAVKVHEAIGDEPAVWHNPAALPLTIDGEETFACPRQSLRENPAYWNRILTYYGMYQQGFMPGPGAVMDQSNKAIEIFRVLDAVNRECDAELTRRAAAKRGDLGFPPGRKP